MSHRIYYGTSKLRDMILRLLQKINIDGSVKYAHLAIDEKGN